MGTLADVITPSATPVRTTRADATVFEAVSDMCRWHVRALVVGDAVDPVGILCEHDILERVVLRRLDPVTTSVQQVMTRPVVSLRADCTPGEALEYMRTHRVHQVPVAGDEALIGVVSASDLKRWALQDAEIQLGACARYIMGK